MRQVCVLQAQGRVQPRHSLSNDCCLCPQAIFDPSKNVHGAGLANISRQLSTYDVDGRGSLNPAGFSRFIRRLRLYPAPANSDIAALFSRYDPHGLGLVSIDQFKVVAWAFWPIVVILCTPSSF